MTAAADIALDLRATRQSGKPQFGYIYGVALLGTLSLYLLLNLMSQTGIDAYRVSSVLGYCLLPLVLTSFFSIALNLDSLIGYVLSIFSIVWCSYAASGIFVSVLQMQNQRYLVAYPVMLFYASFALLTVFQTRGEYALLSPALQTCSSTNSDVLVLTPGVVLSSIAVFPHLGNSNPITR